MNIEVELVCVGCGAESTRTVADGSTATYCSDACKRRAARDRYDALWRTAIGELDEMFFDRTRGIRCPSVGKITYESKRHAWIFIAVRFPDELTLHPYPCDDCEGWHIGNGKGVKGKHKRFLKEVRRAVRQLAEREPTHPLLSALTPPGRGGSGRSGGR